MVSAAGASGVSVPAAGVGGGHGHQPLGCGVKPAAGGTGMHGASMGKRDWDKGRVVGWRDRPRWYLEGGSTNVYVFVNPECVCVSVPSLVTFRL